MNRTYRCFFWFSFWVYVIVTTIQNYLVQPQNFSFLLKFAYSAPLIRLYKQQADYVIETCPMSNEGLVEFLNKRRMFCSNQNKEKNDYLVFQMKDIKYRHAGDLKVYLSCLRFPIVIEATRLEHDTNYITVIPYPYTNQKDCKVKLRWKSFWGGS